MNKAELHIFQEKALALFTAHGFPTTKHEDWRYTPLRGLTEKQWQPAQATLTLPAIPDIIVTDIFTGMQQYPQYFSAFFSLAETADSFYLYNTACFQHGFFILIPENVHCETPIEIHYPELTNEQRASWRNVIIVEKNARATVFESFKTTASTCYFNHAITEATLHSHGTLTHYRHHQESPDSFHLSLLRAKQYDHSQLESHVLSEHGAWIRSDTHICLEAEYTQCTLNGLALGKNKQYIDHHTTVEHLKPHGTSQEYYKAILDNEAHGVFNGKVIVSQDAIKTNAAQQHKTLLLSRSAQINTKPQLEIFSDDVKCTHGASIGQLDEDALFYLQTRGIERTEAQALLVAAFYQDVLDKMPLFKTLAA